MHREVLVTAVYWILGGEPSLLKDVLLLENGCKDGPLTEGGSITLFSYWSVGSRKFLKSF